MHSIYGRQSKFLDRSALTLSSICVQRFDNLDHAAKGGGVRFTTNPIRAVLRVISTSPADLQPVFETMLDNAVRICGFTAGGLCRWDDHALHHVVVRQARPAFAEFLKRTPIYPNPKTNVGRMLLTKTVVHVPDVAAQPAYSEQREPGIVAAVEIGHVRTFLAVPMLRESELIGAILFGRHEFVPSAMGKLRGPELCCSGCHRD